MRASSTTINDDIPEYFICPLTLDIMVDPVMDRYGHSYERSAIRSWINLGNQNCPLTRRELKPSQLVRNSRLKSKIDEWRKQHSQETNKETERDAGDVVGVADFSISEEFQRLQREDEEEEEEDFSLRMLERMAPEERAIIESICRLNFPEARRPFAKRGVFRMLP